MSRTFTVEKTVFMYEELSVKAKEKVKQWLLNDDIRTTLFSESCNEELKNLFPNSDLQVQYSLSYCQGDGLNIYGTLDFYDILEVLKENFSQAEYDTLEKYFDYEHTYNLECNNHYCYCIIKNQNITEDLESSLCNAVDCEEIEHFNTNLLERFNALTKEFLCNLCGKYEKNGYEYFYEMSEDEIASTCESNNYEFYEDGTTY